MPTLARCLCLLAALTMLDTARRCVQAAEPRLLEHGHASGIAPDAAARQPDCAADERLGVMSLREAVRRNCVSKAEELLDAGFNIDAELPLHVAARYQSTAAAAMLIDNGAAVDKRDREGRTALHVAASKCRLLAPGWSGDREGRTALHVAAGCESAEVAAVLIDGGALVDARDNEGRTPLQVAAGCGSAEVAAVLIDGGALADARDNEGRTPLHVAAGCESAEVAAALMTALLMAHDADVDARDDEGRTPLHIAAGHESAEAAAALIERGANVRTGDDEGHAPLHVAAWNESVAVASLLIEHGANVNARTTLGWTPLHFALDGRAAGYGLDPRPPGRGTAHLLLEHGADVNAATDVMGWTPLHLAAHLGGSKVVRHSDGWVGSQFGHGPDVHELVQTLIERGANVNAPAHAGGWTPLRVAKKSNGWEQNGFDASGCKPSATNDNCPGAGSYSIVVQEALRAAGGRDEGCDDAPAVPDYQWGHKWHPEYERRLRRAGAGAKCQFNMRLDMGWAMDEGRETARGSFTAPGTGERLVAVSAALNMIGMFDLTILQDRHGTIRRIMYHGYRMQYQGLCLNRRTNTHAAVFKRVMEERWLEGEWYTYFHYDEGVGTLVPSYETVSRPPLGKDEPCPWREQKGSSSQPASG